MERVSDIDVREIDRRCAPAADPVIARAALVSGENAAPAPTLSGVGKFIGIAVLL